MLKLFLRFYLLMIILFVLMLVSSLQFMMVLPFTRDLFMNGLAAGETSAIFNYLQAQFAKVPESDWPMLLHQLTPAMLHKPIMLEPLNTIILPDNAQKQRLLAGEIVGTAQFFHAPIHDTGDSYAATGYQRIGKSNFALVFQVGQKQHDSPLAIQAWLIHFVSLERAKQSLESFSQAYGTPVKLVPLQTLPAEVQTYLLQNQFLADQSDNLSTLLDFYYLYQPGKVLVIGPFHYPWYIQQFGTVFLVALMALISVFMLGSLYFFYRDLNKLDRLAQAYGEGQFEYNVKIRRWAAMSRLYQNLKTMGLRIERLLNSHQELTEAVSHELKTPLSRLRFALTLAEEAKTKDKIRTNLCHASGAVDDLEQLVQELLLYSRFDRQFIELEQYSLYPAVILPEILKSQQSKHPHKHLSWHIPVDLDTVTINMAPHYFSKLIDNLLSNAYRYAKSAIKVSLSCDKSQLYLEVADDGPGIPEAERQRILQAFVSLDESRNKALSGHGLGLAIVERIMLAHQGRILVKDSVDLEGAALVLIFRLAKFGD